MKVCWVGTQLEQLLSTSHVVSLHCPLSAATTHLVRLTPHSMLRTSLKPLMSFRDSIETPNEF
jgi:lactate dehydrogenase-like 2-hydroxyacid dehydrogenase